MPCIVAWQPARTSTDDGFTAALAAGLCDAAEGLVPFRAGGVDTACFSGVATADGDVPSGEPVLAGELVLGASSGGSTWRGEGDAVSPFGARARTIAPGPLLKRPAKAPSLALSP